MFAGHARIAITATSASLFLLAASLLVTANRSYAQWIDNIHVAGEEIVIVDGGSGIGSVMTHNDTLTYLRLGNRIHLEDPKDIGTKAEWADSILQHRMTVVGRDAFFDTLRVAVPLVLRERADILTFIDRWCLDTYAWAFLKRNANFGELWARICEATDKKLGILLNPSWEQ